MTSQPIYLLDGARTPFLKYEGRVGPFSATELALAAVTPLLLRQCMSSESLAGCVTGCVMPSANEANIARIIALRATGRHDLPAYTVARNCASGMEAIDNAVKDLLLGRGDVILAGGVEAMSHAPLLFPTAMNDFLGELARAKKIGQKLRALARFRPQYLKPIIALMQGLTDPTCGYSMGQTAEVLADDFGITREAMDQYACESHQRLKKAHDQQNLSLVPLFSRDGTCYQHDTGLRADTTVDKLAKLKPFFDKNYGLVTPGNSSQITDGAAFVLLATQRAVDDHQLQPKIAVRDVVWQALEPKRMGLGPAYAIAALLKKAKLSLSEIDTFEVNEAFSAQVLACVEALNDPAFCQTHLDYSEAVGLIPPEKLNPDGGAIAVGHPVGASGARIVWQCASRLCREKLRWGVASLCIGGGQGGAVLLERIA